MVTTLALRGSLEGAPALNETTDDVFARIVQRFAPGATLLRRWQLVGGVSAQMTALDIVCRDRQAMRWVVRCHGSIDRQRNTELALDEFRLLEMLSEFGVAAPTPLHVDASCTLLDAPYLVLGYIDADRAPALLDDALIDAMAVQLAAIHRIEASAAALTFLPQSSAWVVQLLGARSSRLDASIQEGRIRDALERVWPWPQSARSALLHGDFWPGNLLWRGGSIAAVVDWEDAMRGDALLDVAIARLDLLWSAGAAAMQRFTRRYLALSGIDATTLPRWDLCAALRPAFRLSHWARDAAELAHMQRGHAQFVEQAFARVADSA